MEEKTSFLDLCNTMEAISNTKKRLEIQEILCSFLKKMIVEDPVSLISTLYLLTGTVYPQYYNMELGIGESLLKKVICKASGLEPIKCQNMYIEFGDFGKIAMEERVNQLFIKEEQLSILYIYLILRKITRVSGKNANNIKTNIILGVMNKLTGIERKYFVRLLETKLKIGLALQTVLIGLAQSLRHVTFENKCNEKKSEEKNQEICKKTKIYDLEIVEPQELKEANKKANNLFNYLQKPKDENKEDVKEKYSEGLINANFEEKTADEFRNKKSLNNDKLTVKCNDEKNNLIMINEKSDRDVKNDDTEHLKKIVCQNSKLMDDNDINYVIIPIRKFRYTDEQTEDEESVLIEQVKECFNKQPDFSSLVKLIYYYGTREFAKKCLVTPGIPLKPMLAQPIKNMTKMFSKLGDNKFLTEYKYDGERIQIHHADGETWVFSRNCENIGEKYSDLRVLEINKKSFIIDGEVVAYGDEGILPFQILSGRKRTGIDQNQIETKACIFVFDILYFNGKDLLNCNLSERRRVLRENFQEIKNKFHFAKSTAETNEESIEKFFQKSVTSRCEGVMVKLLDSLYRPSVRTNSWIKMKNDYLDKVGDSLDLVVMGAYYGKGKRVGVYGKYLLGAFNEENGKYYACCKIGTGFTDADLINYHEKMSSYIMKSVPDYVYKTNVCPDVWLEPHFVWEVKAASFSLSPIYSVGDINGKGLSLRFPRFIRERTDKTPVTATTTSEILQMYNDEISSSD